MPFSNTKRIIYQSKSLGVGPSPANGAHLTDSFGTPVPMASGLPADGVNLISELFRVQSVSTDWTVTREDVNEFGHLARIGAEIVEAPQANLQFSYFMTDGHNENKLGFNISGAISAISDIITGDQNEKNYFILTTPQGEDAIKNADISNYPVVCIGNGFLSNFSIEAAVGSFATANVTVEGRQFAVDLSTTGHPIPAIDPEDGSEVTDFEYIFPTPKGSPNDMPLVLKHGDMTMELESPFGTSVSASVQSVNIDIPLARETLQKLGTKFDFSREIQFPITVTMAVSAIVNAYKGGKLSDILCNDQEYDLSLDMREPVCVGSGPLAIKVDLKSAKIDSQSFSIDIQGNETVDLQFSTQISSAQDLNTGLFIAGARAIAPVVQKVAVIDDTEEASFSVSYLTSDLDVEYAVVEGSEPLSADDIDAIDAMDWNALTGEGPEAIDLTGLTPATSYVLVVKSEKTGFANKYVQVVFATEAL